MSADDMTRAFATLGASLESHRESGGSDYVIAVAMISAGSTILLSRWGRPRVSALAETLVSRIALATADAERQA